MFDASDRGNSRPDNSWIRFNREFENYSCDNIFIRGLEKVRLSNSTEVLWVCGAIATFPFAVILNSKTLDVDRNFVDFNLSTCARWPEEPVGTVTTEDFSKLFVASGWGLYKSDLTGQKRASTMLYSDWKMTWNGFHWPTRMAMLLGRDVRFIQRIYDRKHYLYFFGHEVNPQYSYINSLTRQSYQSFMLRICKNDTGFTYDAKEDGDKIKEKRKVIKTNFREFWVSKEKKFDSDQTVFSYSQKAREDVYNLPSKIFTSALKFPFGCYLKRYDGAQSTNIFWGQQNILYFNRLADVMVSFNFTDEASYARRHAKSYFSDKYKPYNWKEFYDPNVHIYNSMVGAFTTSGLSQNEFGDGDWQTSFQPSGAVCQFQLSEWKMDHLLEDREPSAPPLHSDVKRKKENGKNDRHDPYATSFAKNTRQYTMSTTYVTDMFQKNPVVNLTAREEFLALYGTFRKDFYSLGTTWLQGLNPPNLPGIDFMSVPTFDRNKLTAMDDAARCGRCLSQMELNNMTRNEFEKIMKYSSFAWPTDWFSHLTKFYDAFFHLNPMSVAGDNASFVIANVEFFKMFILWRNFTDYENANASRAPLIYILLLSTSGDLYFVVMCDLVSYPIRKTKCEFHNTDQPYVTVNSQAMRYNRRGQSEKQRQIRVSSLLSQWKTIDDKNRTEWEKMNPQSPLLKDAMFESASQTLVFVTARRLIRMSIASATICGTYRSCVTCASDPLCMWSVRHSKKPFLMSEGKCLQYDKSLSSSTEIVQDVLGRGQKCERLVNKAVWTTLKVGCSGDFHAMILDCKYKSFFRLNSIRWQRQTSEFKMADIDFEDEDDMSKFMEGPNQSLVVKLLDSFYVLYQCVGTLFDNREDVVLMRYNVTSTDSNHLCEKSYCPLLQRLFFLDYMKKSEYAEKCTSDKRCQREKP